MKNLLETVKDSFEQVEERIYELKDRKTDYEGQNKKK